MEFKATRIRAEPTTASIENILFTAINIFMRSIDTDFRTFFLLQQNRYRRSPSDPICSLPLRAFPNMIRG